MSRVELDAVDNMYVHKGRFLQKSNVLMYSSGKWLTNMKINSCQMNLKFVLNKIYIHKICDHLNFCGGKEKQKY